MVRARWAPFVYFYGIEPGHNRPIWPTFVQEICASDRPGCHSPAGVQLREPGTAVADPYGQTIERRYATVEVKRRLHQDALRHLVLHACAERCAICNLPRRELLDAAHILPDRDARGEPSVRNGLSLCKLHRSAFDADLLGIRPDRVVELSRVLLDASDGPTLEIALKGVAGRALQLPSREDQYPDRVFLEERYEIFRRSALWTAPSAARYEGLRAASPRASAAARSASRNAIPSPSSPCARRCGLGLRYPVDVADQISCS